ncbi:hypothetical protein AN640_02505 [Candidatus Epulonipiscium fishelsonii]|uniref:Uncharacterized protein n=1 Tax=Candidatus Epulonipiscium fishelsonii TaxID=77094 RepID=A0ACC8X8S3_9FIRM|nr:hypothetical protein AN640_02505 [Epulopiscium sp. SCG-D08WGA-EpuloA1]
MNNIMRKRIATILSLAATMSATTYADNGGFNISTIKNRPLAHLETKWKDEDKVHIEEELNFWDIETHWAKDSIKNLISKNILSGYDDGTFRPDEPMTRAELADSIQRIFGIQKDAPRKEFKDVNTKNTLYYDAIETVAGAGILNDYGTEFKPSQLVTKEEALSGIIQAYNMTEYIADQNLNEVFKDAKNISNWTENAINVLLSQGYISAKQDGTFGADDQITRAQFMTLIDNLTQEIITNSGEYEYGYFDGNLVINVENVTLRNTTIDGDLYLAQGIGDGDIILDNVNVTGTLYIEGGGNETVYIKSSKIVNMLLDKYNDKILIKGDKSTEVEKAEIESAAGIDGEFYLGTAIIKVNGTAFEILPEKIKIEEADDDITVTIKGETVTSEDITTENKIKQPLIEKIKDKLEKEKKEKEEKKRLEQAAQENITEDEADNDDDDKKDDGTEEDRNYNLEITTIDETYSDKYTTLACSTGKYGHIANRSIFNVNGYLYVSDKIGDKIILKKYDVDLEIPKLLQEQILSLPEVEIFGGFSMTEDAYFILSGNSNEEELSDIEIIRLEKYDYSGKLIGTASMDATKATVAYPFDVSHVSIKQSGDTLFVHSGKLMYKEKDNLNHQSQLTFAFNTADMTENYSIEHYQSNHISHSFNQYADFDVEQAYIVDLGDAYPRAVVLGKIDPATGRRTLKKELIQIPGRVGDNTTGVQIGGLEVASNTIITVINKYDFGPNNDSTANRGVRDISILVYDKTKEISKEIKLTDYISKGNSASTARLVDMGNDRFMVMWTEYIFDDRKMIDEVFHYVEIDQYGEKLTSIYNHESAKLSADALPLFINNKIVWVAQDLYHEIKIGNPIIRDNVITPIVTAIEQPDKTILELSTSTEGAQIYYTIDGSIASKDSILYDGAFEISENTTLQAIALKDGMKDSEILKIEYVLNQVESPTANIPAGTYTTFQHITLSSLTSGASIYYTTDESFATINSTRYAKPIEITSTTVLKAIAAKDGMGTSNLFEATYTINSITDEPISLFIEQDDEYSVEMLPETDPEVDRLPSQDGGMAPEMGVIPDVNIEILPEIDPEADKLPSQDGGMAP